jgi:hypothetical protein
MRRSETIYAKANTNFHSGPWFWEAVRFHLPSPSRDVRVSEVSGCFPGYLYQHLFVNSQTAGLNPSASAETGLGGLSPLTTKRMAVGSGLLAKGTFPVYS